MVMENNVACKFFKLLLGYQTLAKGGVIAKQLQWGATEGLTQSQEAVNNLEKKLDDPGNGWINGGNHS